MVKRGEIFFILLISTIILMIFSFNNVTAPANENMNIASTIENMNIVPTVENMAIETTETTATFTFTIDQIDAKTIINYGTTSSLDTWSDWNNETSLQRQIVLSNLSNETKYYYSVYAYNGTNQTFNSNSTITSFETSSSTNNANNANNANNTNNTANILPNTGNSIWDETKNLNTTYIWNADSFSDFYYDLDSNLSTENLVISNIQRTIAAGDITYTTSPVEVNFQHPAFGSYQVIGFMADKYFAGYTTNSSISGNKAINVLAEGQLQKILFDDDDKRTVSEGGTLTLQEGYVLKLTAVDVGAGPGQILLSLLKDGTEVDSSVVAGGGDYIYTKKVGSAPDLPIIAVHFDSVFRGSEVNAAFIRGVFQLSESVNSINSGDKYGLMEISGISGNEITMDNTDSVSLSPGTTIGLMGNLTIIVANSDTLRFALSVDRTGEFEVRGTIYPVTTGWTPYNFGLNVGNAGTEGNITNIGFYYDLDEDIGTENLQINSISGNTIPQGGLIYSTSPQEVNFQFPDFGKYQVIGFMADKYFAGYTGNTNPPTPTAPIPTISAISQGELHKILIDDEDQRTISIGGTLTLQDGYVVKATDIDLNARTMLISLLKDGTVVDTAPLSAGDTYVYEKKVGAISNLPIIMMRFDSVFSGTEVQAAFIKGLFQIAEETTSVNTGGDYGSMEVSSVSPTGIEMDNKNSIDLSPGSTVDVMGNIQFKVADSSDVRFYPFVLVTPNLMGNNQLSIDVPSSATAGDTITINITAGNVGIEGASIDIEPEIGKLSNTTDSNGILNYTFPKNSAGIYNITADKVGYQSANTPISIERYIAGRLTINVPATIDQFETIPIKVISNNTPISNATIMYDNSTIGTTDNDGILNYTLQSNGTHTLSASKDLYIGVSLDINIRAPFSDFEAKDINIIPDSTFTNDKVIITSNLTNAGTKGDTKLIELIVNGSSVANTSVNIEPNEIKEINFTYKSPTPGNYTVEILGQKGSLQINKAPFNYLSIGVILTVIGAFIILLLTRKDTTTIGEHIASLRASLKNKIDKERKNGRTL